jgi:hypothetical protein
VGRLPNITSPDFPQLQYQCQTRSTGFSSELWVGWEIRIKLGSSRISHKRLAKKLKSANQWNAFMNFLTNATHSVKNRAEQPKILNVLPLQKIKLSTGQKIGLYFKEVWDNL